jgi:hypothetical protein
MKALGIFGFASMLVSAALAGTPAFLERHAQNPLQASQELPSKSGARSRARFNNEDVWSRRYIAAKDEFRRKKLCTQSLPGEVCSDNNSFLPLELFNEEWVLRSFLGGSYETNILRLSAFNQGSVAVVPWAGHYWPIYQGGIGARYGDAKFPQAESFKINYNYFHKNYLKDPRPDSEKMAILSPAEKYDYMIGDREWNLTKAVWQDGKSYQDANGKVETWMGICHGWAPAAFIIPEPVKAIEIDLGSSKGKLKFYPHDIKGLVSQLWARASFNYNFLGGRCNDKNPKTDPNGRIISSDCFDINPSTWHLALTHWVGMKHQSFVLDATYDYEVWNQPISSYQLTYFNPISRQQGILENSIVSFADVKNDPYAKYRSPAVAYLVGVISEIQYVVEEAPDHDDSIRNPFDRLVTVSYYYDLELDKDHNIIGGEWYQQGHPDMLWKPMPGVFASVRGEENLAEWQGALPLPQDLFQLGTLASAEKMPLAKILNKLVEWSQGQR